MDTKYKWVSNVALGGKSQICKDKLDNQVCFLEDRNEFYSIYWLAHGGFGIKEFAKYVRGYVKDVHGHFSLSREALNLTVRLYQHKHTSNVGALINRIPARFSEEPALMRVSCAAGDLVYDRVNPAFPDKTVIGLASPYRQTDLITKLMLDSATRRPILPSFANSLETALKSFEPLPQLIGGRK